MSIAHNSESNYVREGGLGSVDLRLLKFSIIQQFFSSLFDRVTIISSLFFLKLHNSIV